MSKNLLPAVVIEPTQAAQNSVIWLHGLGADGHDFEPIVPALHLPADVPCRFIFPHAPSRPITINNGYVMPGWFDILSLDRLDKFDRDGINTSVQQITQFIDHEVAQGIAPENIVLAGFSQGGAIALHSALRYPKKLAGIMALSTYLPMHETLSETRSNANSDIPLFMAHGTYDGVLPIDLGKQSYALLDSLLSNKQWHEYPMEHNVCPEEIIDISRWLQALPCWQKVAVEA